MSNQELEKKICELKSYEQMARDLEIEIEALKDEIKAEMTEQNVDKLSTNLFSVYWNRFDTKRFDTKAFKETHAALYEQYCRTTVTRRFMLS